MQVFLRVGVGGRQRTPMVSTQAGQQRSPGEKAQVQPPAAEAMLTPAEPTPRLLLTLHQKQSFLAAQSSHQPLNNLLRFLIQMGLWLDKKISKNNFGHGRAREDKEDTKWLISEPRTHLLNPDKTAVLVSK